jgi:hypothetical protein
VDQDGEAPNPRRLPAPGLREAADIWFDTGRDPVVEWDIAGRQFDLVDPVEPRNRLTLFAADRAARDPARVARALAEGLAACDFPPTGDGASPNHVSKALRAAGIEPAAP